MKKFVSVTTLSAVAGLLLAGCAADEQTATEHAVDGEYFAVQDPWIKATESTMETDSDASMTGAFVHLINVSGEDQTIIGAHAEMAQLVELHEVVDDGGVNLMQEKAGGFPVAADETYELNPGEDHIMLMDLVADIPPGQTVDITLELDNGASQTVAFIAKEFVGAQENYGDLEHHGEDGH